MNLKSKSLDPRVMEYFGQYRQSSERVPIRLERRPRSFWPSPKAALAPLPRAVDEAKMRPSTISDLCPELPYQMRFGQALGPNILDLGVGLLSDTVANESTQAIKRWHAMECDHCSGYVTSEMRICPNCGFPVNDDAPSQVIGRYRKSHVLTGESASRSSKASDKRIPPPSRPHHLDVKSLQESTKIPQGSKKLKPPAAPAKRKDLAPIGKPETVESIQIVAVRQLIPNHAQETGRKNCQVEVQIRRRNSSFVSKMTSRCFHWDFKQSAGKSVPEEYLRLRNWVVRSGLSSKITLDAFANGVAPQPKESSRRIPSGASQVRVQAMNERGIPPSPWDGASIEVERETSSVRLVLIAKRGSEAVRVKTSSSIPLHVFLRDGEMCRDELNRLCLHASRMGITRIHFRKRMN